MAPQKQICLSLIAGVLVTLITSPYHASSDGSYDMVNVSLYYESLCPFCAGFIVNELSKVFNTDLLFIVDLRLVPWGNTEMNNGEPVCQHGPDECLLDTIQACAINAWPDVWTQFKFIRCIESLKLENRYSEWQSCYETEGLDRTPIDDCYNSGLGSQLEQRYAQETANLNPPHKFVPWVLVNNAPIEHDYDDLVNQVCKAYGGPNVPEACRPSTAKVHSFEEANSVGGACYAGEAESWTPIAPAPQNKP